MDGLIDCVPRGPALLANGIRIAPNTFTEVVFHWIAVKLLSPICQSGALTEIFWSHVLNISPEHVRLPVQSGTQTQHRT
jgi:hypothetical protein